jgi:hypothetical protein
MRRTIALVGDSCSNCASSGCLSSGKTSIDPGLGAHRVPLRQRGQTDATNSHHSKEEGAVPLSRQKPHDICGRPTSVTILGATRS